MVFVGFAIYERENVFGSATDESQLLSEEDYNASPVRVKTPSYQERLILLSLPIGPNAHSPKSTARKLHQPDYNSIPMGSPNV